MPLKTQLDSETKSVFGLIYETVNNNLYFILPALVILLLNLAIFNRYFPLTEGWWETYGYLLNKGLVPYKDFSIEFPLLFVVLNKWALKWLPESFAVYRFVGVLSQVALALILQYSLSKFFSRRAAAVSTVFSVMLLMSSPVFIAKDYHTLVDFILAFSFLILARIYVNLSIDEAFNGLLLKTLFLGFCVGLLALVKQNIGAFIFLSYFIVFLFLPRQTLHKRFSVAAIFVVGFFVATGAYVALLLSQQVDFTSIIRVFSDNDSKGSISVVLFRFIIDHTISRIIGLSIFVAAIFLGITYSTSVLKDKIFNFWNDPKRANVAASMFLLFLISVSVVTKGLALNMGIIPLALSVLIYLAVRVYFVRDLESVIGFKLLVIPLLSLVYCNTHTAGLNFPGMFFVIAFTSALTFDYLILHTKIKPVLLSCLVLIPVPIVVANKLNSPYDWWGLKQSSVFEAKYQLPYVQTKNIFVDAETLSSFAEITAAINKYSKTDSDVYLFPNIPIFYYLHNKIPPYRNVVQWFDVISSKKINQELSDFAANPPQVVVFLDPPDSVYLGHANILRRELVHLKFRALFEKLVDAKIFTPYKYIVYEQSLRTLYNPSPIVEVKIRVRNRKYVGRSFAYLYSELGAPDRFVVKELIRDGSRIQIGVLDMVRDNDQLTISLDKSLLKPIAEAIGYLVQSDYYTLKIYIKANSL